MSRIGDTQAFPRSGTPGMTYRQWLIGQALAAELAGGDRWTDSHLSSMARRVIEDVDAMLAAMDREGKP